VTKSILTALAGFVVLTAVTASAQTDAQKSFAQLKTLAGTWEGKNSQGEPLEVSFKVTAGGSAVMNDINGHGDEMITMFHLDGPNRLLMTHYCSSGNQPRMSATASPDGKAIAFTFVDATNLATPDAGHMEHMVLTVVDVNHHTEEWIYADHGKEMKEFFDLHRKM
jgi:hypothetical protein